MATGSQSDILGRLLGRLPPWFSSANAAVSAIMAGAAAALVQIYNMWVYLVAQTRLATCSGGFLDLFAQDHFGSTLVRRPGQSDAALRARISALLFAERGTRRGMTRALTVLTGRAPIIVEMTAPGDTGGYSTNSIGYSTAGRYASVRLTAQFLITAFRPNSMNNLPGYRTSPAGYSSPGSGYGSLSLTGGGITDQDIIDTINAVRPAGVTAWVNISN